MSHESIFLGSNENSNDENDHPDQSSPLVSSFFENEDTLLKQMKTSTLASLLSKSQQISLTNSKYEKALVSDYQNRMSLYISYLFDRNFDLFTPPKSNFLKNYEIGLFFEFYESQFIVISHYEKGIVKYDFAYDFNTIPILECLETGIVSKELFCLLEKMRVKCWDSGILLAKCTDFRIIPNKEFLMKLSIGSEIINYYSAIHIHETDQKKQLEFEKQALLLENPILCTDPSPDVARIYSLVDGREKMWTNHNDRSKEIRARKKIEKPAPQKQSKRSKFAGCPNSIESSQNQFDRLFENYHV